MTTSPLSIQDVVDMDIADKKIFIVGKPAAGKSWLATQLLFKVPHCGVFRTDNYVGHADDYIMSEVKSKWSVNYKVFEGMYCYELLLKSLEDEELSPDIIIDIQISRAQQERIYREGRDARKIKYQAGFWNKHLAMWNKYLSSIEGKENKPTIITVTNIWE